MTPRQKQRQREAMINNLTGADTILVRLECGTWYSHIGHNLIDRLVCIRLNTAQTRWVRWEDITEVEKY